jgi:predicted DNA-binding transcriptional regulator YafY
MFEILRCPQTAKDLAEEFEISVRTVYRYIDDLCGAGVPIVSSLGRNGGFKMADYYKIREFFLTASEKQYLISLLEQQKEEDAKIIKLKINALATL